MLVDFRLISNSFFAQKVLRHLSSTILFRTNGFGNKRNEFLSRSNYCKLKIYRGVCYLTAALPVSTDKLRHFCQTRDNNFYLYIIYCHPCNTPVTNVGIWSFLSCRLFFSTALVIYASLPICDHRSIYHSTTIRMNETKKKKCQFDWRLVSKSQFRTCFVPRRNKFHGFDNSIQYIFNRSQPFKQPSRFTFKFRTPLTNLSFYPN